MWIRIKEKLLFGPDVHLLISMVYWLMLEHSQLPRLSLPNLCKIKHCSIGFHFSSKLMVVQVVEILNSWRMLVNFDELIISTNLVCVLFGLLYTKHDSLWNRNNAFSNSRLAVPLINFAICFIWIFLQSIIQINT